MLSQESKIFFSYLNLYYFSSIFFFIVLVYNFSFLTFKLQQCSPLWLDYA